MEKDILTSHDKYYELFRGLFESGELEVKNGIQLYCNGEPFSLSDLTRITKIFFNAGKEEQQCLAKKI